MASMDDNTKSIKHSVVEHQPCNSAKKNSTSISKDLRKRRKAAYKTMDLAPPPKVLTTLYVFFFQYQT